MLKVIHFLSGQFHIVFVTLMLLLPGCASQPTVADKNSKDAWMKKSFSAKNNTAKKKSDKTSTLIKLPPSPRFRDHILKGKLAHGMSFTDALATLRMKPWGLREQKQVFWCDDLRTQRCHALCGKCDAMLFGKDRIALLGGFIQQLTVTGFYPSKFSDFRASVDENAIDFADQLYRREIRHGMPAGLVQMIINLEGHQTRYFCDNAAQPATESCLGRCNSCRVEITPRFSDQAGLSVFLETQNNLQTVTNVIDR